MSVSINLREIEKERDREENGTKKGRCMWMECTMGAGKVLK